jgi:hypothetical protein
MSADTEFLSLTNEQLRARYRAWCDDMIAMLRAKNDSIHMNEIETAVLRGQISQLKMVRDVWDIDNPKPPPDRNIPKDPGSGY